MIPQEIQKLYGILCSFLGDSKNELDETYQLQFGCPRCTENKGGGESHKYNLEVNLRKGVFQCWSCAQHDDEMHGSITKLIKLYGSDALLYEYKETVNALKSTRLYELKFDKNDFDTESTNSDNIKVTLPLNFRQLSEKDKYSYDERRALEYLFSRGIGWDIIKKHSIGYTIYDENNKLESSRIVLPSHNKYAELNYWTGRDITKIKGRQKYANPNVIRKDVIFNEDLLSWDCDVTLVEGPFDHIVVPNSIPLLGKALKKDFKIYQDIMLKANANVNIFLDGDAYEDVKKIYKLLNHGRLYGKVRYIPTSEELDPSLIYEKFGKKGIISHLRNARQINEVFLL